MYTTYYTYCVIYFPNIIYSITCKYIHVALSVLLVQKLLSEEVLMVSLSHLYVLV